MELIRILKKAYESGYKTAQLEMARNWITEYEQARLSEIKDELDNLRQPYREGSFLERIIYTIGWKRGQKEKARINWLMANV